MEVVFSEHARYQMREREITEEEVLETLNIPDRVLRQPDGRYQYSRKLHGRALVVICAQKEHAIEVVTAFPSSKLKKYL
mgnify:CR=1 FL=1